MSFTTKQLALYDNEESIESERAIFTIQFDQLYTVRTLNHGEHEVLRVKQSDLKKILMVSQWVGPIECSWVFMVLNVCLLQLSYIEDRIAPSASDTAQEVHKLSRHGVREREPLVTSACFTDFYSLGCHSSGY